MSETEKKKIKEENPEEKPVEDEVVDALLKAVRLAEKGRKVEEGQVKIIADSLEFTSMPQLPVQVAEEVKPFSQMLNEQIIKVAESIEDTLRSYQETFKEAVKAQIMEFDKALRELGYIIARSFAEKLNIRILERHLRKLYEDITERVIREKSKEFLENTLQYIVPLYTKITERLQGLQKDINQIRDLYINWIQGFLSLIAEEIKSYQNDIENLKKENAELKAKIAELMNELKALKSSKEFAKEREKMVSEEILKKYQFEIEKRDATINALREQLAEFQKKYEEALKKLEELKEQLKEKELLIQDLQARLSTVREGIKASEELTKIKEYYETQLLEKEKEIRALKAQIEELKNLQNALQTFMKELKTLAPTEIEPEKLVSPDELAKKYREFLDSLRNEILKLRDEYHKKLKELSDIVSRNKVLEERISILEQELKNYKKREEELLRELSQLKSEKAYLENRVKELESQISGSLPQLAELSKILELTLVGKAFLIIKDVKEIDLNRLAAALGTDKFQVRRELLKLVRMGIIRIEGNKVIYVGST